MTESSKPPSGRRMKAHAPPPPSAPQPAPRRIFRNPAPDGGGTSGLDAKENMLRPTVDVLLTLPQGQQIHVTEDGSKALMDLLVELCSRYHLNPALHTLELLSPDGHSLGFKPNTLLGSLNVACVFIKEKVWEEKVVRRPAPKVPEKTVRLMVNYHGNQKAVVRVNPLVPLQVLIPVICDKCDFDPAHVLLLKDSINRHELQLDKSLSDLGIKELYVHDQSLAFQPKMASAPALNSSDSICSSTTSLGKAEKKGLLGIFQFSNRRKSKTETRSMDMDDFDETIIQYTDTQSNALSTVSGLHSLEDRPGTLGQSQSVMNITRMSPKADAKKRRAPAPPGAPTPSMGHTSFESYQMGLGSESQQRKRKAPAPPPTPTSFTQGSDDASTSAAPSPDSQATEIPTPAFRTQVVQSTSVSAATVVIETEKPGPIEVEAQPPPEFSATPTPSSPTPSSSTTDSLAVQDSSSELSHSLDDSDADLDQAGSGSRCSTLSSSTASGSVPVKATTKTSSSKMQKSATIITVKLKEETASDSSSRSETESALNLKLDEVENNRHSAMGNADRQVPPKPRRCPARESPQLVFPSTLTTPPIESTESNPMVEEEEAAPQSWLHSARSSAASDQKPENEIAEDETVSLGGSSSGSSLPDQGYAASEGMLEGEDSGMVSSPSDTQPTSPDGSLSLDGSGRGRGEKLLRPVRDSSSDSDEGCATWGSIHRHSDINSQTQSVRLKNCFEEDPEITAQLHQTLADFEADLADHEVLVSARETPDTMSTDSNEVPVSVVDMDVPVTAIDEVMEVYEHNTVKHEVKALTRTESTGSKGSEFYQKSIMEPQNKNNNAYTAAVSTKKQKEKIKKQHSKPVENKSRGDRKEEEMVETKIIKVSATDTKRVKEDKQTLVKSSAEMQKNSKKTEKSPESVKKNLQAFQQKKPDPSTSQRSVSTEKDEENHRVYQIKSSSSTSQGKITHNVTSRFGMRTFTVVPPKPAVTHTANKQSDVPFTIGAIKIDDQGNMVSSGVFRNKVGGSSESEINHDKSSPLLEKAKAFWSSNEKQESPVIPSKSLVDKAKESTNGEKSASFAFFETMLKTSNTEYLKTTQSTISKPAEKVQLKEVVKEETKELEKDVQAVNEEKVEIKISVSKNIQQPSNKPVLLPPQLADMRRDLSFLKPSRRTSSQYVASAISKYTPVASAKAISTLKSHDYSASSQTQTPAFQRLGRSMQVNPHQSSMSSLSENKEYISTSTSSPGPKRSMSFPEPVSDSQRGFEEVDRGEFKYSVVSTKERLDLLETKTAKNNHIHSSGPTQIKVTANNDRDYIKHIRPRSPSPVKINAVHSSAKPPTAPKTISPNQTSDSTVIIKTVTHLTQNAKPQPSVTVTDSGVIPPPPSVTVFGPIAKFKPVIHKSVEKETSLHSSLMEAIQSGGGRDRLKKVSTSGTKKEPYIEEENERSALLAAIRAQSTGRLRKTKSLAAHELEKLRKVAAEEEKSAASSSSFSYSSSVFTPPPPPPPAPTAAPPPPPPPVLPQAKPSSVAHPNADALKNAALAREVMLEAIRSGSAAERLKKIAVPRNTVQVNGRLGTIHASSSTIPQQ
ncbi:protein cordon-bleu isoform X3 [Amphiprion ocellaris]|uniref:protein cordon-bleu isoform X3 n=1 Tax=Amphiprion ocellaris TaxID=80972 RepID=UPI002410BDDB|nr:protein cordon-bleu isoform X3 [Amphiprion ocellaris]